MGKKSRSVCAAIARALFVTTSAAALTAHTAYAQSAAQPHHDYNIQAQPLASALSEYAQSSGVQLLFAYEPMQGLRAPPLVGRYAPEDALDRLLAGSGYRAFTGDDGVIRLEQITRPQNFAAEAAGDEEIVITGTRLRGQGPSPVTVIERSDIVESGASTVTQILRTLPQNFGGGPNESTRSGDGANNLLQGSSINLRGLGADSTLVLINGRRVSTTGTSNGQFVDVSTIPVAAIERVEVLTDGASAIYGSKQRKKWEGKIKRASRVSPVACMRLEKSNVCDQLKKCSHIALPCARQRRRDSRDKPRSSVPRRRALARSGGNTRSARAPVCPTRPATRSGRTARQA